VRAHRDVTFLVRPSTLSRLHSDGVRIRGVDRVSTTRVNAVTRAELDGPFDVVILGVRSDAVASAIDDMTAAVGVGTRVIPLMNGMAHLPPLIAAFGEDAVLGAAAELATSLLADGTIEEYRPGAQLKIGDLAGDQSDDLRPIAAELGVDGVTVSLTSSVLAAMWEKFAFITSTAALTCLAGDVIGAVARAAGGITLARQLLDEVKSVAAAERNPLADSAQIALNRILTDPASTFAPSMFRDLRAGRPVEGSVLSDLVTRARRHNISTPLLDAALVVIDVRAHRVAND
jgi:2-dehydropantoate 2-reductase